MEHILRIDKKGIEQLSPILALSATMGHIKCYDGFGSSFSGIILDIDLGEMFMAAKLYVFRLININGCYALETISEKEDSEKLWHKGPVYIGMDKEAVIGAVEKNISEECVYLLHEVNLKEVLDAVRKLLQEKIS